MKSIREIAEELIAPAVGKVAPSVYRAMVAEVEEALHVERARCAKIADGVEGEWLMNARNVARADDIVGGLAQSTYTSYAEVAGKIAAAIREG